MKNIIAALTVLLTVTSSNAFFNGNNSWDAPWGNVDKNLFKQDNGFFARNTFSFFDPRWYSTEFTNMVNEFDAPDIQSGNNEDNGIFAYNSFSYFDPRWYSTEFTNMVNEIDDDNNSTNPYQYKEVGSNSFPITDK